MTYPDDAMDDMRIIESGMYAEEKFCPGKVVETWILPPQPTQPDQPAELDAQSPSS